MRPERSYLLPALALALLVAPSALAQEGSPAEVPATPAHARDAGDLARPVSRSSATLPLEEVLRLHRAIDEAEAPKPAAPPVKGAVQKVELAGRLLDGAVELAAHVEAQVFAEGWVVLPLLRQDPAMHVTRLPTLEGASLAVIDGALSLVASRPGAYAFDVGCWVRAHGGGRHREVALRVARAPLSVLRLRFDPALFTLESEAVPQADGAMLFPTDDGLLALRWSEHTAEVKRVAEAKRPPAEAIVAEADFTVVSTLAGRRLTRALYQLRVSDAREFTLTIPEGYAVEKVVLNSVDRGFALQGRELKLTVSPARTGDEQASLELLLSEMPGTLMLTGELSFRFPAVSWRTDVLWVSLHLPEVFNYRWSGGSLAPAENPPTPEFSIGLPTPGKALAFRQQLVTAEPSVQVRYSVDLAGQYWDKAR